MGRKITLAEARERDTYLTFYCGGGFAQYGGCTHSGEMSILFAIALWGEDTRLDDLPLVCSKCGSKKVDVRADHARGIGGNPL